MRRLSTLLLCLRIASAQTPAAPPQPLLSPQAAYDQASAPVDIVHRDLANWSETETASLKVAVAQAKDACLARASQTFTGDDLIAYARLCALGKQWPNTYTAATTYINSKDAQKPQLAMAYTFEVQADLNMEKWKAAASTCFAMMRAVPYGPLTDEVTTTTATFLQFAYLGDALDLLAQRQPHLLSLLRAAQSISAPGPSGSQTAQPAQPAAPQPIPLHTLFEHALDFAALQLYNVQPERAAAALADIDQAMPATMPSDEAILIAADRRQYALLGTHFPDLPGAVSLLLTSETPLRQPKFGAASVFLLFPPWCAQCIRQAQQIVPALVRAALLHGPGNGVYIYALLADAPAPAALKPAKPAPTPAHTHRPGQPEPPSQNAASQSAPSQDATHVTVSLVEPPPPSAEEQLRRTPTLVVDPSTLAEFNASDFPFLIATDHDGIIRLMVRGAPSNALVQDGPIQQITDTVLDNWPPAKKE